MQTTHINIDPFHFLKNTFDTIFLRTNNKTISLHGTKTNTKIVNRKKGAKPNLRPRHGDYSRVVEPVGDHFFFFVPSSDLCEGIRHNASWCFSRWKFNNFPSGFGHFCRAVASPSQYRQYGRWISNRRHVFTRDPFLNYKSGLDSKWVFSNAFYGFFE